MKQNKVPKNEYINGEPSPYRKNPYKDDVLYTEMGQWQYPGQVTRIPGGDITMQGVPYPVYGEDNLGYSQMMYPGMDYHFPGQYVTEIPMAQDGRNVNSLEADLITKVLMNRNKNKDFIQRAYALGQNPGMFTLPDPDQFGYNMSHKMAWGEDETGQAYMFPTVMNPENESIKVPNQYADYISSIGYKKETGIPYEAYGGDPSLPALTGHYPFGGMYTKTHTHMQKGGRTPIYVTDPNDPRLQAYQDSLALYKSINKYPIDLKQPITAYSKEDAAYIKSIYPKANIQVENERVLDNYEKSTFENYGRKTKFKAGKKYSVKDLELEGNKTEQYGNRVSTMPFTRNRGNLITDQKGVPIRSTNISPIAHAYGDMSNKNNWNAGYITLYKKPVQPVVYKKSEEEIPSKIIGWIELPNKVDKDGMHAPVYPKVEKKKETINPDYLPMIQASMPEMITREPEIIMPSAPKPSNTNNRIAWRMDPDTRKMVPVYLEGKTQKVKEGKRLYNKNIPSSTAAIPADFVPQFEPDGNKDVVSKKMGGWLDAYDDEYRRGGQGPYTPYKLKKKAKEHGTSKNIQSSINKIFARNYDIFGPSGRGFYNPNSKYEDGGFYPMAQAGLQAAGTSASTPVSTQAPKVATNPTGWDWVQHKWETRDRGPSMWDLGYMDPDTGSYVDTGVSPFDLMLPVQAVSGAKAAIAAKNIKKATPKSLPKQNVNLGNIKDRVIEPSKTGAALKEELGPYLSHRLPSREADRYARSTANTVDEYAKNWKDAIQHFDREGNAIPDPVQKGVNPGIMDILWDGLLPKTPFNEVPIGNQYYYRKIGNKEGLEDLIKTGTTRQPGNKWEGAFYGWRKPIEDYDGRYAVGYDTKTGTIGMDFCKPGRPGCVGYLPTKKIDINDPALRVYKRKFMSSGYKELDKEKLAEELTKNYTLQEKAENILRPTLAWGSRYVLGHDLYNKMMRPHSKEEDMYLYKVQKTLGLKEYGGSWLDKYGGSPKGWLDNLD